MPQFIHRGYPGQQVSKPGARPKPALVSEAARNQARKNLELQLKNEELIVRCATMRADLEAHRKETHAELETLRRENAELRQKGPPQESAAGSSVDGSSKLSRSVKEQMRAAAASSRSSGSGGTGVTTTTSNNGGSSSCSNGGTNAVMATGAASAAVQPRCSSAVFVHFIPPPLRHKDKKDTPWIVHTCDGSGCKEARHVSFHSVAGFATCEGQPPEQAEGRACECQISNHHLRGVGKVRWEGPDAVIENDDVAAEDVLAYVHRQHREEMRHEREQQAAAQAELRRLREALEKVTLQRDVALGNEALRLQAGRVAEQQHSASKAGASKTEAREIS